MANQKGGVGKTADAIGFAAACAEEGERVLLVDFDPQGHASEALGVGETEDGRTLKLALTDPAWAHDVHDLVTEYRPRLHVIPTNIDMFLLDAAMYTTTGRGLMSLARLLAKFEDEYDVCVVDCAPSLGAGTEAALYAARQRPGRRGGVLIPVEAEDSSIRALQLLLRQIRHLIDTTGTAIDVLGLIPSRFDTRDGYIVTSMLEAFRNLGEPPVLAEIKKRKEIREAWRAKVPVLEYAPKCEASGWYRDLARKVRKGEAA
ncbi:ParA family protein [Streptomyces goshikiensis]|uniref:ParA family protein n=1 Tax=Streptomyces goshikiensis TaxID=1942 RepID=UPI003710D0C6